MKEKRQGSDALVAADKNVATAIRVAGTNFE
jgi:hypothetical protein